MKIEGIQSWRRMVRIVEGLLILVIPFVKIGGESALRFDIPTLALHFFGVSLWMDEFFLLLLAALFFILLIVGITLLFGRIWCGWVCPQTVIADFTDFVEKAARRGFLRKAAALTAVLALSALMAANLIWYFISPYDFFSALRSGDLGKATWTFWSVLTGVTFANLAFIRRRLCADVCPYAKIQSALYDSKTLLIAFDPERKEECLDCLACVKVCPLGIDIRKGQSPACIDCARCVDECTKIRARKGKESLIGYFWGLPGEAGKIVRANAAFIGSATLLFLAFLVYLSLTRIAIDMTVLPNYGYEPVIAAEETVINSFLLSVRNAGRSKELIGIGVEGINETITVTPDELVLNPGEARRVPVYVTVRGVAAGKGKMIELSLRSKQSGKVVTRKANFRIPEK